MGHKPHRLPCRRPRPSPKRGHGQPPPPENVEMAAAEGCTEQHLEGKLVGSLEAMYREAMGRLVAMGHGEELAMEAILQNGHCYGGLDAMANVVENATAYLRSGGSGGERGFGSLHQLVEGSMSGMVCLLQKIRPGLSRAEAMWCLLAGELHLGRATTVDMPPPIGGGGDGDGEDDDDVVKVAALDGGDGGEDFVKIAAFRGGEIDCVKRFNLSPKMRRLLKRNVAVIAAGCKASLNSSKQSQLQSTSCPSSSSLVSEEVLGGLGDLSVDDGGGVGIDEKDEMIASLVVQIKELEVQVKERREWAHQKALQAARKLSSDLTELKVLRMEREETLRMKKGKEITIQDSTMKRLFELEAAVKAAKSQAGVASVALPRLENENADMRTELEASKLSASESISTCLEVAKREKKCLKKILNWEKQKAKLQDDIAREKEKITKLQHELIDVVEARKETEMKWKQEVKAKDAALARVEEEKRAKEAAGARIGRNHEALHRKIEIDSQCHKDDLQRLQEELSRLKASSDLSQVCSNPIKEISSRRNSGRFTVKQTTTGFVNTEIKLQSAGQAEVSSDRHCVKCMKNEVSVVFLPCAHQVLCVQCNLDHEKTYRACPCCNVRIAQRILVYGAGS